MLLNFNQRKKCNYGERRNNGCRKDTIVKSTILLNKKQRTKIRFKSNNSSGTNWKAIYKSHSTSGNYNTYTEMTTVEYSEFCGNESIVKSFFTKQKFEKQKLNLRTQSNEINSFSKYRRSNKNKKAFLSFEDIRFSSNAMLQKYISSIFIIMILISTFTLGNSLMLNNSDIPGAAVEYIVNNDTISNIAFADNPRRKMNGALINSASTTKRSVPDLNVFVTSLTTIATPVLTTQRYNNNNNNRQQINLQHRNYELDLERDHALPTSAPNADILKSNSNPIYPNPNRHHSNDRERYRHMLNSTPLPSLPNSMKKTYEQLPTIPMYSGDVPSYSPPIRTFFTPPLPPEYQNPFADKPTLRGTNNEGIFVNNANTYINRRPIPPPSLMPGHERIPLRPPDLSLSGSTQSAATGKNSTQVQSVTLWSNLEMDNKKTLNTPSLRGNSNTLTTTNEIKELYEVNENINFQERNLKNVDGVKNTQKQVLPSIRRILSGSNGNKGDIPEVLLKQVTLRPSINFHQPPSSPIMLIDGSSQQNDSADRTNSGGSNINKNKEDNDRELFEAGTGNADDSKYNPKSKSIIHISEKNGQNITTRTDFHLISNSSITFGASVDSAAASSTTSTANVGNINNSTLSSSSSGNEKTFSKEAATIQTTWSVAWNIHVYLSVVLYTILAVFSFYKMFTFNKLTHLFSQYYYFCIHFILILICISRVFYLCYDAYNIHSCFHIFVSELLLNLPATFLTISFSVLILFLFIKSFNHKNNRYSAIIRPLTVVVGCGVHVVLCITLHYVESYTMQNQQNLYYQQNQLIFRKKQNHYHQFLLQKPYIDSNNFPSLMFNTVSQQSTSTGASGPPLRVLSLICQIIYIFFCLSLGMLYLYLYRVLKRILQSKSQNYIHGYQNLTYAIHITIATALLFLLLAALQIFGAITISTRPLFFQLPDQIDWLQWGYQFSIRLIEIAIITLISWVVGLKTRSDSDLHQDTNATRDAGFGISYGTEGREKYGHHNHSNVAGFFLPCTSTSSQEQFDTDYPAVCNANTNLHTYTMRTGKLIYDNNFPLNSLTRQSTMQLGANLECNAEYQQHPTYHRPYDTDSLRNSGSQDITEFGGTTKNNRYDHQYKDYLTDSNTDHYENPNFDFLNSKSHTTKNKRELNLGSENSNSNRTCPESLNQHVHTDNYYSEPFQTGYTIVNFENTKLNFVSSKGCPRNFDCWPVYGKENKAELSEENGTNSTIERSRGLKNTNLVDLHMVEKTISKHENIYGSSNSSDYNNEVNKNSNISYGDFHIHIASSPTMAKELITSKASSRHGPIPPDSRHYHSQEQEKKSRISLENYGSNKSVNGTNERNPHMLLNRSPIERIVNYKFKGQSPQNFDDDMMVTSGNAEHADLIETSNGSGRIKSEMSIEISDKENNQINNKNEFHTGKTCNQSNLSKYQHHIHCSGPESDASTISASSSSVSESATSGSMLVAEHGFVRFRALEDINIAEGVGVHNASIRNPNCTTTTSVGGL